MKIDPNISINMNAVHIMCQTGGVELHDGTLVPPEQLASPGGPFEAFCKTLDPNTGYIAAFVPDHSAEDVFFQARDAARRFGIHAQATIEKADMQLDRWRAYKKIMASRQHEGISNG